MTMTPELVESRLPSAWLAVLLCSVLPACEAASGASAGRVALAAVTDENTTRLAEVDPGDPAHVWIVSAAAARRCNDYLFFLQRTSLSHPESAVLLVTDTLAPLRQELQRRRLDLPVVKSHRPLDSLHARLFRIERRDDGSLVLRDSLKITPVDATDHPQKVLDRLGTMLRRSAEDP